MLCPRCGNDRGEFGSPDDAGHECDEDVERRPHWGAERQRGEYPVLIIDDPIKPPVAPAIDDRPREALIIQFEGPWPAAMIGVENGEAVRSLVATGVAGIRRLSARDAFPSPIRNMAELELWVPVEWDARLTAPARTLVHNTLGRWLASAGID